MKKFQQSNRPGGWQGGNKFGEQKQMHKATCVSCGNACTVPFKPNGMKPVFCSDCFKRDDSSGPKRFGGQSAGRDSVRVSFDDKPSFRAICDKCGVSCQVPFRPTGEKPVYCQACFGHGGDARVKHAAPNPNANSNANANQLMDQFKILNGKLDTILKAIKASTPPATVHTVSLETQDETEDELIEVTPQKKVKKVVKKKVTSKKKK